MLAAQPVVLGGWRLPRCRSRGCVRTTGVSIASLWQSLVPDARTALHPELKAAITQFVSENKVVLFMKGTKQAPQCGFSNSCVSILNTCGVPYETVNILEDENLRAGMKEFSSWPTFPQLYIGGEFFGGCDITTAAFQDGSLKERLDAASCE